MESIFLCLLFISPFIHTVRIYVSLVFPFVRPPHSALFFRILADCLLYNVIGFYFPSFLLYILSTNGESVSAHWTFTHRLIQPLERRRRRKRISKSRRSIRKTQFKVCRWQQMEPDGYFFLSFFLCRCYSACNEIKDMKNNFISVFCSPLCLSLSLSLERETKESLARKASCSCRRSKPPAASWGSLIA